MLESLLGYLPSFVTVDHTMAALVGAFIVPVYSWVKAELAKISAGIKAAAAALDTLKAQAAADAAKVAAAATTPPAK